MTKTPLAERTRIVFAGLRNSGKSSLLNHLFEKEVAIVSDTPGTTTDPVTRPFELTGFGPVAFTDTAGLGDEGEIGRLRMEQSQTRISEADILVLVTRDDTPLTSIEMDLIKRAGKTPAIAARTFDSGNKTKCQELERLGINSCPVENLQKKGREELIALIREICQRGSVEPTPLEGLVNEGDFLLLVTPIDLAAPKGRLILPQVETIRDALDRDCSALIVKERELRGIYKRLGTRPELVVTDSQAFHTVAADIYADTKLTSFSILFARKKGDLSAYIRGLERMLNQKGRHRVLVLEACSHHRQADDIGTVKIPRLYRELVSPETDFVFSRELPPEEELKGLTLVISCGGCMVHRKAVLRRLELLGERDIPVMNYGLFLAWAHGLLPRALEPFPLEYGLYNSLFNPV
jgi:[FeFe] hydrogenase H-cluster maturation GTPase HydF